MVNYTEYFTKCCNKEYMAETDVFVFRGILLNYDSGNVVMYNDNNETICHIPFRDLRTLRPITKMIQTEEVE